MIDNLFATPIWYTKLNLPEEIRADLLMQIEKRYQTYKEYLHPQWQCMVHTSHQGSGGNDEINNLNYEKLAPYLHREYRKYSEEIRLPAHDYRIQECWYNYYTKGSNQENHHHLTARDGDYKSIFSGIYFLKMKPEDSQVHFPNENAFRYASYASDYSKMYKFMECMRDFASYGEEDYILLFPAFTQHRVPTQRTDGPRITVSFNFNLEKID